MALYPAIKPYKTHKICVSKLHTLHVEETGNPQGIPIIILHPGPGAGSYQLLRRFFDPELFHIITFDPRGAGRSIPYAEINQNDTTHFLNDINTIKNHLKLDRLILCGGGCGALFALLYAQQYPQQIAGMILYCTFLGRKKDTAWIYHHGANLIYPDYWQEFISLVPGEYHHAVLSYYKEALLGNNEVARMAAAKQWALWHARISNLQPHTGLITESTEPHAALSFAALHAHYLYHHFFIEENQALQNCSQIKSMPVQIIHGRYDMVSPLANAWELHQALPLSHLSIVRDAGHSDYETGIQEAIILASKRCLDWL